MIGSKPGAATSEPPESVGPNRLRAMPPTWKSGIMLRFTSSGRSRHDAITHAAPTTRLSSVYGTTFFLPLVPDVCSTSATSVRSEYRFSHGSARARGDGTA